MANRARVIYQSEALFAGTSDATGYHFTASDNDFTTKTGYKTRQEALDAGFTSDQIRTGIQPLRRVQNANYSFSLNRQDVNQFGQLARIDSISLEPPTVTLDFSYYLTNGINERLLGFNVNKDGKGTSAMQDEILLGKIEDAANPVGKNFFILTTEEGSDAVNNTTATAVEAQDEIPEVPATSDSLTHDGVTYTAVTPGANSGITITILDEQASDEITAVGNDVTVSLDGAVTTKTQQDILDAFNAGPAAVTSLITIAVADTAASLATTISSVALESGSNLIPAVAAVAGSTPGDENSVIALGNGFVSNYSIEAAVGGMPTANVTVEGLNLKAYTGTHNKEIPAVDTSAGTAITGIEFSLPPAITGLGVYSHEDSTHEKGDQTFGDEGISCLRPGDISLKLGSVGDAGEFTILPNDQTKASHIQSFSVDLPISRSVIDRLGSAYGFARVTDFPVNISVQVSAILSELRAGNVTDMLFSSEEHDLEITMKEPHPSGLGKDALKFTVKGCRLEGESFSSSIGDNKTVDLTFTSQIGGPEDKSNGIFISGSRNALTIDDYYA